jgi:large subunit ribosomal protein L25
MSDILQVTLEPRDKSGKQEATKLRNGGYIPAVFYGSGYPQSIPVKVKTREILPAVNSGHWETFRLNVTLPDGKTEMALMRDVQKNFLNGDLLHIDFYQLVSGQKVQVKVPLELVNRETCAGVKAGGILEQFSHEVSIDVLPREIPDVLYVDVRNLALGEEIRLKDIPLPESAELLDDGDSAIVLAAEPRGTETAVSEAEGEQKEVEVLSKGKSKGQEEA